MCTALWWLRCRKVWLWCVKYVLCKGLICSMSMQIYCYKICKLIVIDLCVYCFRQNIFIFTNTMNVYTTHLLLQTLWILYTKHCNIITTKNAVDSRVYTAFPIAAYLSVRLRYLFVYTKKKFLSHRPVPICCRQDCSGIRNEMYTFQPIFVTHLLYYV